MDPKLWGMLQHHIDLLGDLYCRLPLEEYFELRAVCKTWYDVACKRMALNEPINKPFFTLYSRGGRCRPPNSSQSPNPSPPLHLCHLPKPNHPGFGKDGVTHWIRSLRLIKLLQTKKEVFAPFKIVLGSLEHDTQVFKILRVTCGSGSGRQSRVDQITCEGICVRPPDVPFAMGECTSRWNFPGKFWYTILKTRVGALLMLLVDQLIQRYQRNPNITAMIRRGRGMATFWTWLMIQIHCPFRCGSWLMKQTSGECLTACPQVYRVFGLDLRMVPTIWPILQFTQASMEITCLCILGSSSTSGHGGTAFTIWPQRVAHFIMTLEKSWIFFSTDYEEQVIM